MSKGKGAGKGPAIGKGGTVGSFGSPDNNLTMGGQMPGKYVRELKEGVTKEDQGRIFDLRKQGLSPEEISEKLGIVLEVVERFYHLDHPEKRDQEESLRQHHAQAEREKKMRREHEEYLAAQRKKMI